MRIFPMFIVLGARKPLRREVRLKNAIMRFIMLFCSHLAALHHQCFRPSWARNYDCDKEISVPTRQAECSFETR